MILNSPTISGSLTVTGNIIASGSITLSGSVASASYASNAELLDGLDSTVFTLTSSFAAQTASFTAFTASILSYTSSQNILNGTYATTGSNTFAGVLTINSNLIVTGSITAQTLVVQTVTSSVVYSSGSNVFGNNIANTQVFTGSLLLTGSLNANNTLYVSSSNVGIGVSSPTVIPGVNLIVKALSAAGNGYIQALSSDSGCSVALYSGNDVTDDPAIIYQRSLRFGTSTNSAVTGFSQKMVITNSGNVGIGTSSPSQKLEVSGTDNNNLIMSTSTTGAGGTIRIQANEAASYLVSNNARPLYIQTNSVTAMTITSGGSVGIGTSTPTGVTGINLVVKALSAAGNGYIQALSSDSGCSVALYSGNSASDDPSLIYQRNLRFGSATDTATGGYTERMRITSGGNVGIGTTGFSDVRCAVTGVDSTSSNYVFICKNGGGTNLFNLRNDGYFQASGIYNFTSSGGTAVYCASDGGVYRFTSSERYKREITDYTKGLSKVLEIKPKWFKSINPKEGEKIFAGLIAEQIDEIGLNEFVEYNDEGQPDAVHYSAMTALLVKAIQELKTQNDALQSRIETLESK